MSVLQRRVTAPLAPVPDGKTVPWAWVLIALVGAAVTVVCTIALGTLTGPGGLFGLATDIEVYRAGARQLWSGRPVYDQPLVTVGLLQLLFTYPPFAAVAFLPLAAFDDATLSWCAYLGNAALLATVIGLSMRRLGYRMTVTYGCFVTAATVALLSTEPVHTTFASGQINLLLLVIIIADIGRPSGRLRGVGVGIAAGLKLTPLIFVVYLLATRQWRTAATALATFTATVLVGFVAMPADAWQYWTDKVMNSERIGVIDGMANQSVNGYVSQVLRLLDAESFRDATGSFVAPGWMWLPIAAAAGLLGVLAARVAHQRGPELLAIAVIGMTGCVVSPFSWGHHWVWLVPLLLVTLDRASTGATRDVRAWVPPAIIVAVAFAWPFALSSKRGFDIGLFMMPRPASPSWLQTIIFLLVSGCYPVLFVVTTITILSGYLAIAGRRRPRPTDGQPSAGQAIPASRRKSGPSHRPVW